MCILNIVFFSFILTKGRPLKKNVMEMIEVLNKCYKYAFII